MVYSETGERQELAGRESIAFDFIADDIDRARDKYDAKCEQNRENRNKRPSTDDNDRQRPSTDDNDRDKSKSKTKTKTKSESELNTPATAELMHAREDNDLSRVMTFFLDRVNPTPSPLCLDSLKQYTASLGADVVLHALSIALDERKTGWSYIQAILSRYERDGLRNIEAVLQAEQRHNAGKNQQQPQQPQKLKQSESYDLRYMVEWPEGSGNWQDMRTIPGYDKR